MELWDAYNKDFNKIENMILERGKSIPEGVFHLVCEIVVKHIDGSYLLMQRDYQKHLGGLWELTAGGSALKGENAFDCAYRELQEETGIKSNNLVEINRIAQEENHTLYVEYLCVTDCPKDAIILQAGETIAYKWVTLEELKTMATKELAATRTLKTLGIH